MDEGCAHVQATQFEFTIAVGQPKHLFRPSDARHIGFTEPEV